MIERIKKVIGKVTENEAIIPSLTEDTDIINDVGLDSLQMIDFMLQLEEEFNIELEFDSLDISHLKSIRSLADFIAAHQNAVAKPAGNS